ncbi:MAG TPA: hypothetical protein VEG29_05890 [Candidatus Binatia bacterium]|nr:hypothetical protein [Candidatus Binatia bacterium]
MQLDRRLVGWGLIFILVGAVPLAVNAGWLDRDLVANWVDLWPLVIVAIGVSIVLSRTPAAWLGTVAMAVVVGSMVGGLVVTGFHGFPGVNGCGGGTAQPFAAESGSMGASGQLNVEFDCGTLNVSSLAGSAWQLSGTDGQGNAPEVSNLGDRVSIRSNSNPGSFFSRGKVVWNLAVPQAPSLDLGLTLNAGEGNVDLSGATIASLNVTVNAGSLDATLGSAAASNAVNMTVNAGSATLGTGATSGTLNLSLNAGSLDVCIPAGSTARVAWHGTLASHDLDGAGLVKVDDHTWTTQGFSAAAPHFELDVNANAGSFSLKLGGNCGA